MNPVTRYVKDVEKNLSGMRRIGISAKIYKALSIKVDALEAKLGRELTDAEMEALLAEFGAPADVAASYSAMDAPMPDLVERYLAAVERRLPKEQSKDIVAELREGLTAKMEAKEAALGHAASADHVAAILKEFGHPVVVASRYSGRDYLIGPNLYPWFWDAQRVGVGLVFAIVIAITATKALAAESVMRAVFQGIGGAIEAAIWMFGVITVVFIVMERTKADVHFARTWNPKRLPHDNIRPPRPLFDTLFALAFDAIFILWWTKVVDFSLTLPTRGEELEGVHLSPVWAQVYLPILGLALLTAAAHVADIVHPGWSRLRSAVSIAGHVGGLVVIGVLLQDGQQLLAASVPGNETRAVEVAWFAGGPFKLVLGFIGAFWAIGLGVEVWRQVKATRPAAPAAVAA